MTKQTCPRCGSVEVDLRRPDTYRYRESGLTNVVLRGGVAVLKCRSCKTTCVNIEKEQQLLQLIALAFLMRSGHLSGSELRFLRRAVEWSQAELAGRLGVRRETVAEREAKASPGLDSGTELLARVVFLKAFLDVLAQDDNDHLAVEHHRQLQEFRAAILDLAERIQQHVRKKPLELRQVRNAWESELLSA